MCYEGLRPILKAMRGSRTGWLVSLPGVIRLDAATVLLQWAVGGLAFLWFTTRRREVGLGYGWLLRGTYLLMAASAAILGLRFGPVLGPRDQRRGCRRLRRCSPWSCRSFGVAPGCRGSPTSTTAARNASPR